MKLKQSDLDWIVTERSEGAN